MLKTTHFCVLVALLLGSRLISMALYPLTGTSEPRYAEIARLMVLTNDWVTPWFSPGVPFWGKPPLSFWAQAASFKLFGINEFSARLPSWLATVFSAGLIYKLATVQFGRRVAQISVLVFLSCILVVAASGAVITDTIFAMATTWAMVSYLMAQTRPHWAWRYGFFVALALGLLTKGPLMGVLVAGPVLVGILTSKEARRWVSAMPWFFGLIATSLISLPWYILAELKTPGFINYFLVGEHFYRFINPGWSGDLYGTAHREMKGKIWVEYMAAALPWSLIAAVVFIHALSNLPGRVGMMKSFRDPIRLYLISWALFSPIFFTVSGNILWTYVLPALPAFAILLALALDKHIDKTVYLRRSLIPIVLSVPLASIIFFGLGVFKPMTINTEKHLIEEALAQMKPQDQLAYLGEIPFSATFYSNGKVQSLDIDSFRQRAAGDTVFLAVPNETWAASKESLFQNTPPIAASKSHVLIKVESSRP